MSPPMIRRAVFWAVTSGLILLLSALIIPSLGHVSAKARRAVDASNLRQIGQSIILYALEHQDTLPAATDIWDYARILADDTGLTYPGLWQSKDDPASDLVTRMPSSVLAPGTAKPRPLDPDFRQLKPSVAVALGKLNTRMPSTTPIAWTRGLQPNGTWSAHSPYGTTGGYITFLGGYTAFFKGLNYGEGDLIRFDGKGQTANILEALPPGTRISEYIPTPSEQREWAESLARTQKMGRVSQYAPLTFLAILWLPFIVISVYRLIKKRPGTFTVLLWPAAFTIVLFFILPGCW